MHKTHEEKPKAGLPQSVLGLLNPIKVSWNVHIAAVKLRNANVAARPEETDTAYLKPAYGL